jgi:Ca2+-binding RTX toxin-like protein
VTLRGPAATRLRVANNGTVLVDGEPCASAADTNQIRVDGGPGPQRLTLDLAGTGFGDIPIEAGLGGAADTLAVAGTADPQLVRLERSSLLADAGVGSSRVELRGIDLIAVAGGGGADQVRTDGSKRPLRLAGGHGQDLLEGGRARDRIDGEGGDDRCDGGARTDALISCTPPFDASSDPLDAEQRERMTGRSWHQGCPVGLDRLRLLDLPHWTMGDRDVHRGKLVVHRDVDREVLKAMRALLAARFEIRRMHVIDRYGGDDHRSMDADNTSAFNCRFVAGTTRWSEHAFGRAIDVNPVENPYVSGDHVSPPAGRPFANRARRAPGMVHRGDAAFRAFARIGWKWGGDWSPARDYQHFSNTGR